MRRALWFGLDLLIVLSAAIAVAVLLTGGAVFEWHGELIRAQRARNPLWALCVLALLRFGLGPGVAFLARWPLEPWAGAAARACEWLTGTLGGISSAQARRLVVAMLTISAAMKVWNACRYPGFSYGDDVEVHLMSFSVLQGRDLGVWTLRSPVYPLVFIYPIQWALVAIGLQDPEWLILGGRLVVVGFSLANVWLIFRLGACLFGSNAIGVLAAYLLAISRLHVRMGSTELPRTVSTTFLLLAFQWLLGKRGRLGAALAGMAVGVAGALRFSETVFALPLALQLVWERRWRDVFVCGVTALLSLAFLLGPGDRLYWPEMFFSLRNVVDFTLIRGESSRGFEPLAHYLITAPWWSDPFMLLLIVWGWRAAPRAVRLWGIVPVAVLSLFPHKEERYLLPVLPLLALIAAAGAWRLLEGARSQPASRRPQLALFVLLGVTLLELEGFRFRRSESAIEVARFLVARSDVHSVAMEDGTTTSGANLYLLPPRQLFNLDGRTLDQAAPFWSFLSRAQAQYVVLRERRLTPVHRALLARAGYSEVSGPKGKGGEAYGIFARAAR